MSSGQPDKVSNLEWRGILDVSVVCGLVLCLCKGELIAELVVDSLEALEEFLRQGVDGFCSRIGDLDGTAGVSAIVSVEGRNLCRGMFCVIIGEFCEGE